MLANVGPPWPEVQVWSERLPQWFVRACAPEQTPEEAEAWLRWWRSLPVQEQARASREQRWTLADWLFWLETSERTWFWWGAVVDSPDTARLIVEVPGWPAPLGALDWLLRAAGAVEILHEEPTTA